jgi:hypothetical protein
MALLTINPHLELLSNFYIKKNDVDIKLASNSSDTKNTTSFNKRVLNELFYSWNRGTSKTLFNIPDNKDELTGEDMSILNNVSFIHSILYLVDTNYYASLTSQKRKDCLEFIEVFRKDICSKQKISKEISELLQNLDNHTYTDSCISHIVNYFDSFHLIVLSSDNTEPPKLFINGHSKGKKTPDTYKSASSLVILYFDNTKEVYYPVLYNIEKRDNLFISWREEEYLGFIKNTMLWGKPVQTNKWAVADLRAWISFFELSIDPALDKKAILEAFPTSI